MEQGRIVVVGGSAGAIQPLTRLLQRLPADFPAPIAVVLHRSPRSVPGVLTRILARSSALPVLEGEAAAKLIPGRVYLAPADLHMIVEGRTVKAIPGPRENYHRPSIDLLFRSAARSWGAGTVAVVLSGTRQDGVSGLATVRARGGLACVQSPEDAQFAALPEAAIAGAGADHVGTVEELADVILRVAREPSPEGPVEPPAERPKHPFVDEPGAEVPPDPPGSGPPVPTFFTCVECGGPLIAVDDDSGEYRCYIGHGTTEEELLEQKEEERERVLWSGVRALEEAAALSLRLAGRMGRSGATHAKKSFEERAERALRDARILRRIAGGRLGDDGDPEE